MEPRLVEERLRERGCSLTPQRRAVLQFLHANPEHPTAGQVFEAVTREFPVASRATVYNTLALLTEIGAVTTTQSPGGEVRYDPNVDDHHHLVCTRCGR